MREPRSRILSFGVAWFLATQTGAGPIRPTAEMGPRARRILAGVAAERTARDQARESRERAGTAALVRVDAPGLPAAVSDEVARIAAGTLRALGFKVRPYAAVRERLARLGPEVLESDLTMRQLCRRLRTGVLVQIDVPAWQLGSAERAGFASPSWWSEADRGRELALVQLRVRVYEEGPGKTTRDRQDRQWSFVPPVPPGGVAADRTGLLTELAGVALGHLLAGLDPGRPRDPLGREVAPAGNRKGPGSAGPPQSNPAPAREAVGPQASARP